MTLKCVDGSVRKGCPGLLQVPGNRNRVVELVCPEPCPVKEVGQAMGIIEIMGAWDGLGWAGMAWGSSGRGPRLANAALLGGSGLFMPDYTFPAFPPCTNPDIRSDLCWMVQRCKRWGGDWDLFGNQHFQSVDPRRVSSQSCLIFWPWLASYAPNVCSETFQ